MCAVSTARPEESRGSDCGTGRGLAYIESTYLGYGEMAQFSNTDYANNLNADIPALDFA